MALRKQGLLPLLVAVLAALASSVHAGGYHNHHKHHKEHHGGHGKDGYKGEVLFDESAVHVSSGSIKPHSVIIWCELNFRVVLMQAAFDAHTVFCGAMLGSYPACQSHGSECVFHYDCSVAAAPLLNICVTVMADPSLRTGSHRLETIK